MLTYIARSQQTLGRAIAAGSAPNPGNLYGIHLARLVDLSPRRPSSVGSGEGPAGARGGRTSSSHQRPLGLSCDPWDQPPSGSMDTSMRWSPSLSAVLSGGKVCSIQDLFPRRPSSVGRGGALPPADRPQRGGAIPSGGRSVRLGSPRRPSSVGSPPFPGRTWWWWRRYSKPAKAWAARGGDRWPSPVGLMARNNYQYFVELNVSTCGATDATAEVLTRCRQTARRRATSLGG